VGLRRLSDRDVELSHMYVRPERRGKGVGRALLEAALATAAELGYERVRLETVEELVEAITLYRSAGFVPIEPYQPPPLATPPFMELGIGGKGSSSPAGTMGGSNSTWARPGSSARREAGEPTGRLARPRRG